MEISLHLGSRSFVSPLQVKLGKNRAGSNPMNIPNFRENNFFCAVFVE